MSRPVTIRCTIRRNVCIDTQTNPPSHFNPFRRAPNMILSPCNIELTKIHYYSEKSGFSSSERREKTFDKKAIIKKNVFGRRWVLEINEEERGSKEKRSKVVVYVLVFCSIVMAIGFGVFLTLDKHLFRSSDEFEKGDFLSTKNITNNSSVHFNLRLADSAEIVPKNKLNETAEEPPSTAKYTFCSACIKDQEICLKTKETEKPECVLARDPNDPTGCGGYCQLNTHYCHTLDRNARVYQCLVLKTTPQCSNGMIKCGNRCIPKESKCDGVTDCTDGSDERNCGRLILG